MCATKNKEAPVISELALPQLKIHIEDLVESLSISLDSEEKLVEFLKRLDKEYGNYDMTLAAAKFFLKEIREDFKMAGEHFEVNEVFKDELA